MATTINEDKLLAISDSISQIAGNDATIQNLQEQVSALNNLAGDGVFELRNTYDLVIRNDAEFNDVLTKSKGYTDGSGVVHPKDFWYNHKNMPAASVLIIGPLNLTDSVTVPASVKTLDFQGNGSMALKGKIRESGLEFKGDTTIKGLKIVSGGGSVSTNLISGGGSFINCNITLEDEPIEMAFANAKNLYNCQVTGNGISTFFMQCNNLFGCYAQGNNGTIGYFYCNRMDGCLAENVDEAFLNCDKLSNCRGATVKSIGFDNCRYLNNCDVTMAPETDGTGFSICYYITGCRVELGSIGYYKCSYVNNCNFERPRVEEGKEKGTGFIKCNHITGCHVEQGSTGYQECSVMSACTSTAKINQIDSHYPCNLWFSYTSEEYPGVNLTPPSTSS